MTSESVAGQVKPFDLQVWNFWLPQKAFAVPPPRLLGE
jgi:hypothetical protein